MVVKTKVLVAESCLTLWDPMDCSPPGSSIRGTLQARRLEWVAMPSSRGSSQPRDRTWVSCFGRRILDHLSHPGSPGRLGTTALRMLFTRDFLKSSENKTVVQS